MTEPNDYDGNPDDIEMLHTCENCGEVEPHLDEFQADEFGDVYCPECYPKHAVTLELVNFSSQKWEDVLDGPWIDLVNAWQLAKERMDKQRTELNRTYDRIAQAIRNFVGKQYVSKMELWMFINRIEEAICGLKYGHLFALEALKHDKKQLDDIIVSLQEMSGKGENDQ